MTGGRLSEIPSGKKEENSPFAGLQGLLMNEECKFSRKIGIKR